ncbi:hypothetical protein QMT40_001766 [Parvibaculaceae bacterium PLY_AMNH_Bact1]|nr:hypothetical protein QMT40_001766 [Parvibaculaceae bacterium PLY_AMNH_Bact1]
MVFSSLKVGAACLAVGLIVGFGGGYKVANWQNDSAMLAQIEDHEETRQVNDKADFKAAARRNLERERRSTETRTRTSEAIQDAENDDHCGLTELGSMRFNAFLQGMPTEPGSDSAKAAAPAN